MPRVKGAWSTTESDGNNFRVWLKAYLPNISQVHLDWACCVNSCLAYTQHTPYNRNSLYLGPSSRK